MSWGNNYGYGQFSPYVSVAARRAKAAKHAQKMAKAGAKLSPVKIEGRTIARTFWGSAWCAHLESFSDYANRLPRGRAYVRNGSVLDIQLARGKITAMVMGSSLYHSTIAIAPHKPARWQAIKAECAGKIDSLVGLLQGRLSDAVMRIIADRDKGLFPQPSEITLKCSCPDSAGLCKHLAAVLYGIGARLDTQPELLFVLRGVDHLDLIGAAADVTALAPADAGAMDAAELADVFGIEIAPVEKGALQVKEKNKTSGVKKSAKSSVPKAVAVRVVPGKKSAPARRSAPKRAAKQLRGKSM
jgi:uncharacterized Zn finger protein